MYAYWAYYCIPVSIRRSCDTLDALLDALDALLDALLCGDNAPGTAMASSTPYPEEEEADDTRERS